MHRSSLPKFLAILFYCSINFASEANGSGPEWIWPRKDRESPQQASFQKAFELAAVPPRVELRLVADFTTAKILINGSDVAGVESYGRPLRAQVASYLREGKNTISVRCQGVDGPSAVAFALWARNETEKPLVRSDTSWSSSLSFGRVSPERWKASDTTISALDDYTQWKRATNQGAGTDPSSFLVPEGFEIELLRSASKDEDSWVGMAFDPQGRLTVAMEQKGLLRFTLPRSDKGDIKVERINESLLECRGLLYAYGSLYANANNSKGLYRLRDTDGDDQFDEIKLLYRSSGGVGHGRNDLTLGSDGMIYSIHGDAVDLPRDCPDRTSPFREHRRGKKTREGHVIRMDRDGKHREVVLAGLRNPFGIDFNHDGEMFTYDADAEHDMGSPWYRPTRVNHLLPGGDFGWRGVTRQWPPYYPDRADAAPPTLDIGKGSPTAVKFGYASNFPRPYRNALFALDWTYGRVLAVHATPRGASYSCRAETFLRGRPLNVTDLAFGPEGAMYLITGGRKTQSALYRIKYVGPRIDKPPLTPQQRARIAHAREARQLRRALEELHAPDKRAVEFAWPFLDHPDPVIRHAARIAVEHQPVEDWQTRALNEDRLTASLTALMSLAAGAESNLLPKVVARLNEISLKQLTTSNKWTALRVYQISLDRRASLEGAAKQAVASNLDAIYPDRSTRVNLLLSKLLARLDAASVVSKSLDLLDRADNQAEKLHYLFVLRNFNSGWTAGFRQRYLQHLRDMHRFRGGEGMPGFISRITDEALSHLKGDELANAKNFLERDVSSNEVVTNSNRKLVRRWTTNELLAAMKKNNGPADLARGHKTFAVARCVLCHRVGDRGQAVGPDLTSVAARFSTQDLLESILKPSKVVAEKYQSDVVTTVTGRVITGRIVQSGDYRLPTLRISTDPLDPSKVVEISKSEIESHARSPVSRMPQGLLDTLEANEIVDLVAYIRSGGQRE